MGQEYYMIFKIGDEEYGVDINDTVSIITMTQITRVPKTPSYIKGAAGEVLPTLRAVSQKHLVILKASLI